MSRARDRGSSIAVKEIDHDARTFAKEVGMSPCTLYQSFLERCNLDPAALDATVMNRLQEQLASANSSINLTRVTSREEFWIRHVLDSLSVGIARPDWMKEQLRIADVGCGAGFPMLPLAWANPRLTLTGFDSVAKKVDFVKAQLQRLALGNCTAVHGRARELRSEDHAGAYDAVVLRAVGDSGKMLREVRHLLADRPGVEVINYKTPPAVETEIDIAWREAKKFGFEVHRSECFSLPDQHGDRQFLIFRKQ
jgi:16S rRNA (guanine527-N7)-methyltransferase